MNQTNPQDQGRTGSHSDFENYDLVSDARRIASALAEINSQLILVSVRLDADGPLYDSRILRLDEAAQTLVLDKLAPLDEQIQLSTEQDLYVYATLRGIAIRFTTTVKEVATTGETTHYACAYPEQMLYLQRRDLFRVPLPRHDHRTVSISDRDGGQEIVGKLQDLSIKGFCIEVEASEVNQHQLGSSFYYHGMSLPETRTALAGEALLVNLRASTSPGYLSAGFAIIDLDPQTERSLMRAALYFQRESRKMSK
ncbi:flagellar brake protein [Thiorhodococcus mannitoliphagus]|uniref:Flagellar brake protein n=1 Tax=Thiorhodococcus mannitoliphagus TaxID=329406 RepID=A0A6P1DWS4_9GAMM|nr:flagellar brake protein [Thiorhodococcus mannitoliphagus]NEX20144.1 flagellar brake protein [Thiorhodococcus mannitoliphagus]